MIFDTLNFYALDTCISKPPSPAIRIFEDKLWSTHHQEQLKTIAEQGLWGKSFWSKTSFILLKAPSMASGTSSPFHQLTFGTAPLVTASDHIYISEELVHNPIMLSATFLESMQSPPISPQQANPIWWLSLRAQWQIMLTRTPPCST